MSHAESCQFGERQLEVTAKMVQESRGCVYLPVRVRYFPWLIDAEDMKSEANN